MSFPGFTEDPIQVLAGAAASLMTSRREGFGLAVAESLAAGTPVVTYDVDYGPAELVEDGVNGRVVADGSVEDLAGALVEVLGDPEAWGRMSSSAPSCCTRLHPDVVAAQWIHLAADVAARIDVPSCEFLVEDLRVRRGGLDVEGVVIGAPGLPGRVGIVGGVEVPLEWVGDASGRRRRGRARGPVRSPGTSCATLPWSAVAQWPQAAALSARTGDGTTLPVIGPGLPVTVAPTDRGRRPGGLGRAGGTWCGELVGPDPIPVTGRLTSVRASVGEDVTVLSEVPIARAKLVGSSLGLHDAGRHAPAGACPDRGLRARGRGRGRRPRGSRRPVPGRAGGSDASPGAVPGVIEWDPAGVGRAQGRRGVARAGLARRGALPEDGCPGGGRPGVGPVHERGRSLGAGRLADRAGDARPRSRPCASGRRRRRAG